MATSRASLLSRFPPISQVLPAAGVVVFVVFTWSLYRMFFQLPSWLGYLSLGKVLSLAAYVLAFTLFESLVVLGFLLVLSALLPGKWLRADFAVQASSLAVLTAFSAYLVQRKVGLLYKLAPEQLALYALSALTGILLAAWFFALIYQRIPRLRKLAISMAERMTVFNFVYIPLGALGLLIVVLRNLL